MVYCTKCGTENEDDAQTCVNCGVSLRQPPERVFRRRWDDDLCFGTRRGFPIWVMFFGILIIIAGIISLLENVYWWASWDRLWPILIIAFGLLIVLNNFWKR